MRITHLTLALGMLLSVATAQTPPPPLASGPLLAPPLATPEVIAAPTATPVAQPAPPAPLGYLMPTPATYRWGWFGTERHSQPAQWHYDYQRSAMRWKYCK